MHKLEEKIVELGAIDTAIESISIGEWFDNASITFLGQEDVGKVICDFNNCFDISLKHDKSYSKGKNLKGELDYKYFIQDLNIVEEEGFFIFKISAWPLDGEIICKEILVTAEDEE